MKSRAERIATFHWPLLIVVLFIGALGIYNLHSAAAARDSSLFLTQAIWFGAGLALAFITMAPDYRITESLAYVFYIIVCLLLLAVLLQGHSAGGAKRWLVIGPAKFQPSELAKLATVFCLARYFSHRMREGGYSFRLLFRPLNPSRPLAVLFMVTVFWSRPWMVDPIGELARFIHASDLPELGELLWFRIAIILLIVISVTGGIVFLRGWSRRMALLNPWPPGRLRRAIGLVIALALGAGVMLALGWDEPALRDPFGVILRGLHQGADEGGVYAALRVGWTLRVILLLSAVAYGIASFASLRGGVTSPVDTLIAPIDLLLLPALLILVEPDLGTAGIVILIGFTMIMIVGVRLRSMLIMGVLGAAVAAVAWFGVLKDYQKRRILTFIDPEQDIQGAGWNATQSLIAVGSGRWWGKGHLDGTQSQLSFLPEQHTDFAFSVWAEEQGFFGCTVVLLLYLLLLTLAFNVAREARDAYGTLLAVGVAALVLWHTLINVGMVIGVMPVVGLTLPLFSYGGSSLLTMMIGIGILLNVHLRRRAA